MKYVLALIVACLLTACGGGGGSSAVSTNTTAPKANFLVGSAGQDSAIYTTVPASFSADKSPYVVAGGWSSNGSNINVPLKIFKINADGTGSDVTSTVLGSSNVTASINYVIIADFNEDGIDDIFLLGFHDSPVNNFTSGVYLSQPNGQPHKYVTVDGSAWNHGAYALDVNNDGHMDVVDNQGKMWINDGHGNFRFIDRDYNVNSIQTVWMNGSGVCGGDFYHTGKNQIVITDVNNNGSLPIQDTIVYEIGNDQNYTAMAQHVLPMPIYDIGNTTGVEHSHDVTCRAVDLNGDGMLDLLVFSRPNLAATNTTNWTDQGTVQVLINQGNWVFNDVTATAMAGYNNKVNITYTPIIVDLNGDGILDLWCSSYDETTGLANSAWINDGKGNFHQSLATQINALASNGPAVPVKVGNSWSIFFSQLTLSPGFSNFVFYVTQPIFNFQ